MRQTKQTAFQGWVEFLQPALDLGEDCLEEMIDKAHRRGAISTAMARRLAKFYDVPAPSSSDSRKD